MPEMMAIISQVAKLRVASAGRPGDGRYMTGPRLHLVALRAATGTSLPRQNAKQGPEQIPPHAPSAGAVLPGIEQLFSACPREGLARGLTRLENR